MIGSHHQSFYLQTGTNLLVITNVTEPAILRPLAILLLSHITIGIFVARRSLIKSSI